MNNVELKAIFGELASQYGFNRRGKSWVLASDERIISLDLQKSNYVNAFYLNIKIFIPGVFGKDYATDYPFHNEPGHIFRREPPQYSQAFDLSTQLTSAARSQLINNLFGNFLKYFAEKTVSISSILQYANENPSEIYLLPSVKKALEATANA